MKKNWTVPAIETLDINQTALGLNFTSSDGTILGIINIPGPCNPTDPVKPDDPS